MIYAPVYHGKHNYKNYDYLRKEIEYYFDFDRIYEPEINNLIIDIDLLYSEEVFSYLENVFIISYLKINPIAIIGFQSKDSRKITKVRKILRKYIIYYKTTTKRKTKYLVQIIRK